MRLLVSSPFLVASVWFFLHLNLVTMFLSVGLLIPPAFILAEPLSELLAHPLGSIYNPGKRRTGPALMFSQPDACIMRGRYDRAMELYRAMIPVDPRDVRIYQGMIDLALRHLHDHELAGEVFHQGMTAMESTEARRLLADEYRRLLALFDGGDRRGGGPPCASG